MIRTTALSMDEDCNRVRPGRTDRLVYRCTKKVGHRGACNIDAIEYPRHRRAVHSDIKSSPYKGRHVAVRMLAGAGAR